MATRLTTEPSRERRASGRVAPAATSWAPNAMLRPGHEVVIVNIATQGLLVRTGSRLLPGKRVELQLIGNGARHTVGGSILRCRVVGLNPVCYEAAIAVQEGLTLPSEQSDAIESGSGHG